MRSFKPLLRPTVGIFLQRFAPDCKTRIIQVQHSNDAPFSVDENEQTFLEDILFEFGLNDHRQPVLLFTHIHWSTTEKNLGEGVKGSHSIPRSNSKINEGSAGISIVICLPIRITTGVSGTRSLSLIRSEEHTS